MSSCRLTKKEFKNRSRSATRLAMLKRQSFKPVIKAVDIEQIKQEYRTGIAAKQENTDKSADKA